MTQVIGLLDLKSSTRGIVPALVTHTIECLLYVCVCVCVFPLRREWEKELYKWKTGGQPSLMRALSRCYGPRVIAIGIVFMVVVSGYATLLASLSLPPKPNITHIKKNI